MLFRSFNEKRPKIPALKYGDFRAFFIKVLECNPPFGIDIVDQINHDKHVEQKSGYIKITILTIPVKIQRLKKPYL